MGHIYCLGHKKEIQATHISCGTCSITKFRSGESSAEKDELNSFKKKKKEKKSQFQTCTVHHFKYRQHNS